MMMVGIIIAVVGFVGLMAWFFFDKFKKQFSKGSEKLAGILIRNDPAIERINLEIDTGRYLVDHTKRRAWLLITSAIQRLPDGKVAGVVLTNDSCIPQYVGATQADLTEICKKLKEENSLRVHNRAMAAIEEQNRAHPDSELGKWLGVAICLSAGAVGIIAIIILLTSGLMPW